MTLEDYRFFQFLQSYCRDSIKPHKINSRKISEYTVFKTVPKMRYADNKVGEWGKEKEDSRQPFVR